MSFVNEKEFLLTINKSRKTFTITFFEGASLGAMQAVLGVYYAYGIQAIGQDVVRHLKVQFAKEGDVIVQTPTGPAVLEDVSFSNPQVEVPANWTPCHLTYCKGKIPPRDGKI